MPAAYGSPRKIALRAARSAFTLAALAALFSCARSGAKADRDAAAETSPLPLEAAFSGCARVRAGPVCELDASRRVRIFVASTRDTDVAFRAGDSELAPESSRAVAGGTLVTLIAPKGARALRAEVASDAERRRFSLEIDERPPPRWYDEAKALRRDGKVDDARRLAREAREASGAEIGDRVRALGLEARIALTAGAFDEAERIFRESIPLARASSLVSDAAEDSFALAYMLNERLQRTADARAVLDAVAPLVASYPDGKPRLAYQEAQLTRATGDSRATLRALAEATARGERIGLTSLVRNARESTALELGRLGRHDEAIAILRTIEAEDAGKAAPCDRLNVTNNIAVEELRASERGEPAASAFDDPLRRLGEAAELAEKGCADPFRKASVLAELALALTRAGRVVEAEARLRAAHAAMPKPRAELGPFLLEVDGRVALAAGRPRDALASFDRARALARLSLLRYAEWSAALWRAIALEKLGRARLPEALASYAEAEALLGEASLSVPLGEGRGSFLADRELGARARLDLLVRTGDAAGAMAAARASAARVVATLASAEQLASLSGERRAAWQAALEAYRRERAALDAETSRDWERSGAELSQAKDARDARHARLRASLEQALSALRGAAPPAALSTRAAGTALLVFHPIREGWAALLEDGRGALAVRVGALTPNAPPEALASALLAPFREALARAQRVRIIPYGAARDVDFHALPWNGAALVDALPVEYGLDGAASLGAHARGVDDGVLVVADPSGDLASAQSDGEAVAKLLAGAGAHVSTLVGGEATAPAFAQAFGRASFFFFAGHGAYAGRDGLESSLLLADGARVTASDLLAQPAAPRHVVLAACEAARAERAVPAEGLGLAQALLIAGGESVVAPTRPLRDADVGGLSRDLAAAYSQAVAWDAADALRSAQRRARRERADSDWAAFRALVR